MSFKSNIFHGPVISWNLSSAFVLDTILLMIFLLSPGGSILMDGILSGTDFYLHLPLSYFYAAFIARLTLEVAL